VTITPAPSDTASQSDTTPPSTPATPHEAAAPMIASRIYVDVAGAVRRPSLYALAPGSRVMQAIVAAGGPAAGADLDAINLAQKIADGDKIYVPKRAATATASEPPSDTTPPPTRAAKTGSTSHSGKIMADSGQQIALNTAAAEELERLPGVGPAMAARILAYRAQAGSFGKLEDLMQVTGIGPKKFAKIAPFVKLN